MEQTKNKAGRPFREFLEKSVNLMTVFGILNALFLFSTNYKHSGSFQFLGIGFFVMSIVVWVELILFALDCSDNTWRYGMFYLMSCIVGIGLGWLFVEVFRTSCCWVDSWDIIWIYVSGNLFICFFHKEIFEKY
jgi:hypothetical protein